MSWAPATIFTSFQAPRSSLASRDPSLQRQLMANEGLFSFMKGKKRSYISRPVQCPFEVLEPEAVSQVPVSEHLWVCFSLGLAQYQLSEGLLNLVIKSVVLDQTETNSLAHGPECQSRQ